MAHDSIPSLNSNVRYNSHDARLTCHSLMSDVVSAASPSTMCFGTLLSFICANHQLELMSSGERNSR